MGRRDKTLTEFQMVCVSVAFKEAEYSGGKDQEDRCSKPAWAKS
jgi:hypothetical protein